MNKEEQLKIVENIKNNNYKINIIINDTEPYVVYEAIDVATILEMTNIRNAISHFNEKEKITCKSNTKSGLKDKNYLTHSGLIRLIYNSRKPKTISFCNNIGIDIKNTIYFSIESETIDCILNTFNGETMIHQYAVGGYRIDLYFVEYKLAIECDEDVHNRKTNIKNDILREERIKKEINGITFIRYKPYDKDFNIYKLLNEIFVFIKKSMV